MNSDTVQIIGLDTGVSARPDKRAALVTAMACGVGARRPEIRRKCRPLIEDGS